MNAPEPNPGKRTGLWIALVALVALIAGYAAWRHFGWEQYRVIESPDARFRIVVYRRAIWPSTTPGHGSDAPGVVRLYDRSGRLLQEAEIPMVQQINDLEWSRDHVTVPLVFDWKLPD